MLATSSKPHVDASHVIVRDTTARAPGPDSARYYITLLTNRHPSSRIQLLLMFIMYKEPIYGERSLRNLSPSESLVNAKATSYHVHRA